MQRQFRRFGLSLMAMLLALALGCVGTILFMSASAERLFGVTSLESQLLQRLNGVEEAIVQYEIYPSATSRAAMRAAYESGRSLVEELFSACEGQNPEIRMLSQAVKASYESYGAHIGRLSGLDKPVGDSQAFYLSYYDTLETGDYVEGYLKELMQETLADWFVSYERQGVYFQGIPALLTVVLLLAGGLTVLVSRWVTARIVNPVLLLAEAAHSMAAQGMDIPDVPVVSDDEIGSLTRTFNRMKDDCRSLLTAQQEKDALMQELYEERLQLSDARSRLSSARLAMLKNQINPHFLFNTLSLITQTARQEGAQETDELIQRLSALLRYNLYNREDRVTIRRELENLYSYMFIQETRFLDRLVFWVDCQVETDGYYLPTFTLQPLVENAVSHGVGPKERGGAVRIRILEHDQVLRVYITDNGVGMDREELERLRRLEERTDREDGGIGVANVAARLAILCPESRIHIFSRKNLGTSIRLELPLGWARKERKGN